MVSDIVASHKLFNDKMELLRKIKIQTFEKKKKLEKLLSFIFNFQFQSISYRFSSIAAES